jgi:predicted esterase
MPRFLPLALCALLVPSFSRGADDDDIKDVPSQDLKVGKDTNKRYFLIGPAKDAKAPAKGYGLIVLLPGGPGSADFHPFVKRIYKNAVPEGYLVAQPVAAKWNAKQEIVWPTAKNKDAVEGLKFTTEEFVDAVIDDVAAKHKLNADRVFTLTWSSSGPAAYAASLTNPKVRGSFVAMSVYKPDQLPKLDGAKGHAYYLYHSPDDRICPYRMAEQASKELDKAGAKVKLVDYDGGHGWRGPLYDNISTGIKWLEENATPAKK